VELGHARETLCNMVDDMDKTEGLVNVDLDWDRPLLQHLVNKRFAGVALEGHRVADGDWPIITVSLKLNFRRSAQNHFLGINPVT
jgi:hypothetical protein